MRTENKIPPKTKVELTLAVPLEDVRVSLEENLGLVESLCNATARLQSYPPASSPGTIRDVVSSVEIAMSVADVGESVRKNQQRELQDLEQAIARAEGLLSNEQYLAKAPPQVVGESRARLAQMQDRRGSLRHSLGLH
jgi:valyl-tRNA synthetase